MAKKITSPKRFLRLPINNLPPKFFKELKENPAFFIHLAFDEWLWSKQREIAFALKKYRFVAVYSCHSSGKSHLASRLLIWFSQTHPDSISIVTAPKYEQAKDVLWRGVIEAWAKSQLQLQGVPYSTFWEIKAGKWYAKVTSTKKEDSFQGVHAPYLLFVFDEATGIPDPIWEATEANLASGEGYWLVIGNPLRPEGRFYKTLFDPTFYKVKISAFDTPLFTGEIDEIPPKYAEVLRKVLITPKFVENAKLKYGEDSPYYKVKVLAEFPTETSSSMFKVADIEACMKKKSVEVTTPIVITCDPARYGDDYTVITVWEGYKMVELIPLKGKPLSFVGNLIGSLTAKWRATSIIIDANGLGAGLVDMLRANKDIAKKANVIEVYASEKAFNDRVYADARTEMYFLLKEKIENRELSLINSKELKQELLAMEYTFTGKGQFKLVNKDVIRKKIGRSPDFADATALRFYVWGERPKVAVY